MLPIFPEVTETPQQLVEEDFKLVVTSKYQLYQSIFKYLYLSLHTDSASNQGYQEGHKSALGKI